MYTTFVITLILLLYSIQQSSADESSTDQNSTPKSAFHPFQLPPRIDHSPFWQKCLEEKRIVGGEPAHITEAPYQVGIRQINFPLQSVWRSHLICGGSLIGPRLVLSAAHCFSSKPDNPYFYKVTLGNTFRLDKTPGALERNVEMVIIHPEFRVRPSIKFDIALIILDKRVGESPFIKFVELASRPAEDNQLCVVTGWGREDFYKQNRPNCMMKATVPILNLDECRRRSMLPIEDGFLCAGYFEGGIDACNGDSGGPLVCDGVQYGIVSYGSGCAEKNLPGVYTDVYQNLEWITKESVNGGRSWSSSKMLLFLVLIMWVKVANTF
ncbi:trypsin 3A1-like [Armigeres subalbatus]|uniref:trypsin 3A1-like n=1 Tax=Armigeres subalbatus TaxID=124917 RepID=UPI002ED28F5E